MADISRRTTVSGRAWDQQPQGRSTTLNSIYVGFVKDTNDIHRQGRLRVWIPEIGGDKTNPDSWLTVSYCPPFGGATSIFDNTNAGDWESTQKSYGMWFVPPDLENEVVCGFINGDPGRGIWWACLYNQYMNHMVPGLPGNSTTEPGPPVAEYNKLTATDPFKASRPSYSPLADQLTLQGLISDNLRGISSSGAQRYAPANKVYGWLTPGGSQMVYDDNPDNSFIRIRTRSGAQVLVSDTTGGVYINSRDGLNWIEMSSDGYIDVYAAQDVSIRSQGNMNFHADGDMLFNAGGSIAMKARGQTRQYSPIIFLDATEAVNTIVGKANYSYHGQYKIADQILETPSTIPPIISNASVQTGNTTVSTNAIPSSNSNVNTWTMTVDNTIAIGDDISAGFASNFGCGIISGPDIIALNNTMNSIGSSIDSKYAVISIGSGDDYTQIKTPDLYVSLRNSIPKTVSVVWILPSINRVAAALEQTIASNNGDYTVDLLKNSQISLAIDQIHPMDYSQLTSSILNVHSNISASSSNSTVSSNNPGAVVGGISLQNGQYVQFTKDAESSFNGPVYQVSGVGSSIKLTNTSTNETAGRISFESAEDYHVMSHGSIYHSSIGSHHRLANGDLYDTAVGNINRLSGGSITEQSAGGNYTIRSSGEIILSGTKIHSNGPLAGNAKQATQADNIVDSLLPDTSYTSTSQTIVEKPTIVTRMPAHEPWPEHEQPGSASGGPVYGRGAAYSSNSYKSVAPLAVITGPHLAWGMKVSNYANGGATFRGKVWDMATKLGLPPADQAAPNYSGADWLMAVMNWESAGSFSPSKKCAVSSATGLIQFMKSTAIALGTTTDALAAMTPEAQLDYVYKYLSAHSGKYATLSDLYMAVLYPAAIGKPENSIIFPSGSANYNSNHGLDQGNKGYVTKADAAARVHDSLLNGVRVGNIWQAVQTVGILGKNY